MIENDPPQAQPNKISFRNAATTFVVSVIFVVGILVTRKLALGTSDPFQEGCPLFLQATACLAAFIVSWRWNHGVTSAIGLYSRTRRLARCICDSLSVNLRSRESH